MSIYIPENSKMTNEDTWMLTTTTEGFFQARTHNIKSTNAKEIHAFINKNGSSCHGFSFAYGVNHVTGKVYEIVKKGKFAQRDFNKTLELGCTEYFLSNAFAGKNFRLPNGTIVPLTETIEVNPNTITKEAMRFAKCF